MIDYWLAKACAVFAGVESLGLQRVRDLACDAHGDLPAGVGMAGTVVHGPKGWRQVACIGAVILAAKGK